MDVEQITRAEREIERQAEVITKAEADLQQLRKRAAEMEQQRDQILKRRQAGKSKPDDPLDYDLAGRWLEELRGDIEQRQQALAKDQQDLDRVRQLLSHHQQRRASEEREAKRKAMLQHARALEQALVGALRELAELGEHQQKLSTHAAGWWPSTELRKAVENQYLPQPGQQQAGPRRVA